MHYIHDYLVMLIYMCVLMNQRKSVVNALSGFESPGVNWRYLRCEVPDKFAAFVFLELGFPHGDQAPAKVHLCLDGHHAACVVITSSRSCDLYYLMCARVYDRIKKIVTCCMFSFCLMVVGFYFHTG